jgi:peroxiredoxin
MKGFSTELHTNISSPELSKSDFKFALPEDSVLKDSGKPAPDFVLKDIDGNEAKLADFKGKVVLIDFWASWCGPCKRAMPHIQRIYEKYKDKDVVVLGINTRESQEGKVEPFLKEHKITYRTLVDNDGKVAKQYRVRGIPALFLIDMEGRIQFKHTGFRENLFDVLSGEIEKLKGADTEKPKEKEKKQSAVVSKPTEVSKPKTFALGRLLFITEHKERFTTLSSYLKEHGAEISFIKTDELNKLGSIRVDIIIIGMDTGRFWNSQSRSILSQLFENYKVIGMGDGGARLFYQLELEIGWGHGMHSNSTALVVEIPELIKSPFSISTTDNVIEVYRPGHDVVGIHDRGSPALAGFEGIARWVTYPNHWPVCRQGNYVLWAFDAPDRNMTTTGKQLFVNLLINHKSYPSTPLSESRKKKNYIESGLISDRLTSQFSGRKWVFKVEHAGKIRGTLKWTSPNHQLALILNGPGQVGYFARKDGASPLTVEFDVTREHILKGKDWSINVVSFENLMNTVIDFEINLSFP